MKTKILVRGLICFFLITCTITVHKRMDAAELSSGDVIVPVYYIGGLDNLKKRKHGDLIITNSAIKFVSKKGIVYFNFPISLISGVYAGDDEIKRHFGRTLKWVVGNLSLGGRRDSIVIAMEFTDEEKNIVANPIFLIQKGGGDGPTLKKTIETKMYTETSPKPRITTVRLEVNQSWEAPYQKMSLPFEEVAKSLMEYAGLKVINLSADAYDVHLIIEARGKIIDMKAEAENAYGSRVPVTVFVGVELFGIISLTKQGLEPYKKKFSGKRTWGWIEVVVDRASVRGDTTRLNNAIDGIFYKDAFMKKLCEMIVSVFNLDPVEFYLDVFKDINDNICCAAAQILGKIGDSRAVEPLILGMKFISEYHRPALIEALGELGDPRAIEHLIPFLRGQHRPALKALEKLTGQEFGRNRKKWKKWWKENKDKFLEKQ